MKNSLRLTLITPLAAFNLSAATLHVGPGGFSTIQDAVDAAAAGDRILVTNGVYATGGRAVATSDSDNRVLVNKAVRVQSINGPQFTAIQGDRLVLAPPRENSTPRSSGLGACSSTTVRSYPGSR